MRGPLGTTDIRRLSEDEMFAFSSWLLASPRETLASYPAAYRLLPAVELCHSRLAATMNIVETEEVKLIAAKAREAYLQLRTQMGAVRHAIETYGYAGEDEKAEADQLIEALGLNREEHRSWTIYAQRILELESTLGGGLTGRLEQVLTPGGNALEALREAAHWAGQLKEWDGRRARLLSMRRPSIQVSVTESRREWLTAVLDFVNALLDEAPRDKHEELLGPFVELLSQAGRDRL